MSQTLKLATKASLLAKLFPELWVESLLGARSKVIKTHKTLEEMPGPSALGFFTDLFCKRGLSRLHELQIEGKAKYGPVWKASFGPILTVHVADPSLIEQVLRQEGKHPIRSDLSSWKDYRVCRGHAYGLLTAEGEEWQQIRSILGKHMLKPKEVESYTGTLNDVVSDLICRLQHQRNLHERHVVKNVADEFYKFGLEGISSVLFESRIGCLEPKVPEETEKFISSINTMFVMTLLTMAMPKFLHQIFPKPWQKFCESWDYMFEFAKGHIDKRMAEVSERINQGEKVEGKYLTYYLAQEKLSMKSIYGNVTELLLAGVDTISSTLSWSLYELSRHPQIQAAVHEEITTVMQDGLIPTAAEVAQMPLLKAVVKEVLRLYPVIPGNARVISDRDIQVGDYIIPKKTLITLCHFATSRDEKYFSDPNSFQPERWLQKNASHHPYASIPFGFGKRSCIGRRIAELEVYLALARILMHFKVKPEEEGQIVSPMTRTLLVPEKDINLQFLSR
ncbi:25-hydroxyvitamin D-1 alpha hydroxylase, mitochondrial [Protobothrops mucrosquamatus]|uniref:25-hydroxyvitamin D-1 alpha hydroxylase, mitochondrial n=1 Tax=Protobothrops mucrosquamatus TaxID=103944 RepID=UPI0007758C6F|nr:25-hydroxyvitamin D-1 alpha hydroxylase, mitochondrial [Protobothrops mucrosquamatus]